MRKLIYALSASLDGYAAGPDGDLSWGLIDAELHRHFNEMERGIELALYGRGMYELMSAYWPAADANPDASPEEVEYAQIWRAQNRLVFSRTLPEVGWNAELVREIDADEIRRLKALPGGDMSIGGPTLAASFLRLGLVDEVRMYLHPVILGAGLPMFLPEAGQVDLRLVDAHRFSSGVMMLRYTIPGRG
ncbi:MAG TPA: dihydrofolate reductase [Chloroflexi bacterium]|nr:dihydrofolate reductase [Chloroflexota bacterium]